MNFIGLLSFASGPIAGALLSLITIPIMAWVFSPTDVGRLNILQVSVSFVLLLSVLGLDQAYVREYHTSEDRPRLLITCFLPGFLFLIVITIVALPFSNQLSNFLFGHESPWIFVMAAVTFILNYVSRFLSLILRMQERGWEFSLSHILSKALQLTLIVAIALSTIEKNFFLLAGITLTSIATVSLVYLRYTKDEWLPAVKKRVNLSDLKELFNFGFPLIFSGLAYWGLTATSTLALRTWSQLEEIAVYSIANSFAGAAFIFQSIFTVVWAPTVYKWISQDVDMKIIDTVAQQALAIVCTIVALCGSLSWLCDWLLPAQYVDVKYILLCILMQPLQYTLSEVTCVGIGIQRRTMYSLWITLAALATNISLGFLLVPSYGAAGAAVANAIAFTVFFVARTEVSARIWRTFPRLKLYLYMAALLTGSSMTVFAGPSSPEAVHVLWAVLLLTLALVFRNQWVEIRTLLRTNP